MESGSDENPYLRPAPTHGSDDVADEPALSAGFSKESTSEELHLLADEPALSAQTPAEPDDIEHTVWDEPTLVSQSGGAEAPEDQLTYARWLEAGIARTTWLEAWGLTFLIVLAAGPWGVLGALVASLTENQIGWTNLLAVGVLAPVTEEITKLAAALWVVEKRPHWFKSMWQVLICAAAGGLAFAAIENLIYTNVYIPDGGESFRAWRWTVCTGLHLNCSTLAGFGLVRIWSNAIRERRRPELALGMPFFAMAMVGHGLYNVTVTFAEAAGWLTF